MLEVGKNQKRNLGSWNQEEMKDRKRSSVVEETCVTVIGLRIMPRNPKLDNTVRIRT